MSSLDWITLGNSAFSTKYVIIEWGGRCIQLIEIVTVVQFRAIWRMTMTTLQYTISRGMDCYPSTFLIAAEDLWGALFTSWVVPSRAKAGMPRSQHCFLFRLGRCQECLGMGGGGHKFASLHSLAKKFSRVDHPPTSQLHRIWRSVTRHFQQCMRFIILMLFHTVNCNVDMVNMIRIDDSRRYDSQVRVQPASLSSLLIFVITPKLWSLCKPITLSTQSTSTKEQCSASRKNVFVVSNAFVYQFA